MTFTEQNAAPGNPRRQSVFQSVPSMHSLLRRLALLFTLTAASLLHGQDGPEPTDAEKEFFRDFKHAALAADHAWIATHVCFPVRAQIEGRARMIANAEELEAVLPQIMTLDVVNAIRRQSAESLVRTRQGVMIADGEVWIDGDPTSPASGAPKVCIIAFGNSG